MTSLKVSTLIACSFVVFCLLYAGRYDRPPSIKTFLDRHGKVIGTLNPAFGGLQMWVPLEQIPDTFIQKTIQTEDRWYGWHRGVNPVSLFQAAWTDLRAGRVVRGGSTITQQLARNLLQEKRGVAQPRRWSSKLEETLLALALEMKHSKRWILERYLNSIYYGQRCYGVAAAGKHYFDKDLSVLTEEEVDLLVKLPKAPSRLPLTLPLSHGSTSSPSRAESRDKGRGNIREEGSARHFMEWVTHTADVGPVVHTTLDLDLQKRLEEIVQKMPVRKLEAEEDPKLTVAIVVMDVSSGEIRAMVGSRNYFDTLIDGQVNGAVSLRQPGSTLKPFTYYAAFQRGYTSFTTLQDRPISYLVPGNDEAEGYAPQNFDRRYHGEVTVRQALGNSYNIPAVDVLNDIGLSYYHETLKRFGFTSLQKPPPHYGLAVTLGSGEVTLLELTNAYAALAREGRFLPYRFLKSQEKKFPMPVGSMSARAALEVTSILTDPAARLKAFGANEDLVVEGHPVAVKTGTSYASRDNWTVGYTPSVAVGVWVGHADGSPLGGTTGASGAGPLWHAVMETILRGRVAEAFPRDRVLSLNVSLRSAEGGEAISRDHAGDGHALRARHDMYRPWKILSPVTGSTYRFHDMISPDTQGIVAEAVSGEEGIHLEWYLDNEKISETDERRARVLLTPTPGKHRLIVRGPGGQEVVAFRIVGGDS